MHLHSLIAKNYRALRTAQVSFDETTVLIGENDCGTSSLLSALRVLLVSGNDGRPVIERHHFHRPADPKLPLQGPAMIRLLFEEGAAGEWSEKTLGSLATLLPPPAGGSRRLAVKVEAEAPEGAARPSRSASCGPGRACSSWR